MSTHWAQFHSTLPEHSLVFEMASIHTRGYSMDVLPPSLSVSWLNPPRSNSFHSCAMVFRSSLSQVPSPFFCNSASLKTWPTKLNAPLHDSPFYLQIAWLEFVSQAAVTLSYFGPFFWFNQESFTLSSLKSTPLVNNKTGGGTNQELCDPFSLPFVFIISLIPSRPILSSFSFWLK